MNTRATAMALGLARTRSVCSNKMGIQTVDRILTHNQNDKKTGHLFGLVSSTAHNVCKRIHSDCLNSQCAVTGLAPVDGSITARQSSDSSDSVNLRQAQQLLPSINHSALDISDIEIGQRQPDLLVTAFSAQLHSESNKSFGG